MGARDVKRRFLFVGLLVLLLFLDTASVVEGKNYTDIYDPVERTSQELENWKHLILLKCPGLVLGWDVAEVTAVSSAD